MRDFLRVSTVSVLGVLAFVGPVSAVQTDLASQTLGRGFTHVFIAYVVLWALVLGWVLLIARRLTRVEDRAHRE